MRTKTKAMGRSVVLLTVVVSSALVPVRLAT